jgi:hypothetical protein
MPLAALRRAEQLPARQDAERVGWLVPGIGGTTRREEGGKVCSSCLSISRVPRAKTDFAVEGRRSGVPGTATASEARRRAAPDGGWARVGWGLGAVAGRADLFWT